MSETLVIYDRMCSAITECIRVDEAKDIRDKSLALAAYYRQARNEEAERGAIEIRLRASRRIGELLKEMTRVTPSEAGTLGGRGNKSGPSDRDRFSPYAQALAENNISTQDASRYQTLAEVPEDEFEAAMTGPQKPSEWALLGYGRKQQDTRTPEVCDDALRIWGHMRDIERQGFFEPTCDHQAISQQMTDQMRADIRRLLPLMRILLTTLGGVYEHA